MVRPTTKGRDTRRIRRTMPLQNRVSPFGALLAVSARGTLMGNRGGRFHRDDRTLGSRRRASRQWICCELDFKGRRRDVWGRGYTELFFLDEVTALAAGHRPCFECRHADATVFARTWAAARPGPVPRASEMDAVLHAERLDARAKRRHRRPMDALPDGAVVAMGEEAFAVRGRLLLRWTSAGYGDALGRPADRDADVLTPPAILAVLAGGYAPRWHESAAIMARAVASTPWTRPRR
jgi:hypothetical protein